METTIKITKLDFTRLNNLINNLKQSSRTTMTDLGFLKSELGRAEKIDSEKIAPDFVTMNSKIEVTDPDTDKIMTVQLVYPNEADFKQGKVSVLSPLGAALIGYKVGSEISFPVPKGTKMMKITKIIYQPEANGLFRE